MIAPKRAAATADSYDVAIRTKIAPVIGSVAIADLTAMHVESMLAHFARKNEGARTRQNAFKVLRAALKRAVRLGLITSNPTDLVDAPRYRRKKIEPFTVDDALRIFDETQGERLHAVYVLAFSTGMRQEELFGLHWSDIDFDAATATIRRAAAEVRGHIEVKEAKSDDGHRSIRLTARCIDALHARRQLAMAEGHASAERVFTNERGGIVRRSNFGNRRWKPLLKRLEIRHRGLHHARHTAASLMLSDGVPAHEVSKYIGHADVSTTLNTYAHLIPGHNAARDAMDRALGRPAQEKSG